MPKLSEVLCVLCAFSVVRASKDCPTLVTDFSQDDCIAMTDTDSFYYDLDEDSCIPTCKKYEDEKGENCPPSQRCMPGYVCDKRCGSSGALYNMHCETNDDCPGDLFDPGSCDSYCVPDSTKAFCMAYHINAGDYKDTYWTAMRFKPSCNNDGTWKAKQCKGGVEGRCMCFDASGNRIFGEAPFRESQNMTCACSRKIAETSLAKNTTTLTFHCDSVGNFEPLQCDMTSQQCWCVEPKTGDLTAPVVPMKALRLLPCYAEHLVGAQYLRQCESKKYAQSRAKEVFKRHGVTYVTEDFLLCDNDGSYGSYTIEKFSAYCTWRDNSKISTWEIDVQSGYDNLDCNCARDYYQYQHNQICTAAGSYKMFQHDLDNWYCVDSDGFAKTDIFVNPENTTDAFCTQFY